MYLSFNEVGHYYGRLVACASGMGVVAALVFWLIVRPDQLSNGA